MEKTQTVQFVKNLFNDVWTNLQQDSIETYYDKSLVGSVGKEHINYQAILNRMAYIKEHYKTVQNDIREIIVDEDKVVIHLSQTLFNKSGQSENFKVIGIYKLKNNKVIEINAWTSPEINYFEAI